MSLELDRRKRIHNHIMALHLGCTFVLMGVLLKYLNVNPANMYPAFLVYFFALSTLFLLEVWLLWDYDKSRLTGNARGFLYVLFPAVVAGLVLFIAGPEVPYTKVALLLPVLTAGSLAGKGEAYAAGFFMIGMLLVYEVFLGQTVWVAVNRDFVLIAVIILAA